MITIIAAVAQNNALGKDNQLIWHLPDDLKRFKKLTHNHHIIMGRKTFESLPCILPNRKHIVISRNSNYQKNDIIVVRNVEEVLKIVPKYELIFVIGGGEIYNLFMNIADKIELTQVHYSFEADTFFPEIDPQKWKIIASEFHSKDQKHQYDFTFKTYIRRSSV